MLTVKICDFIWSILDQKAVLDYGIETGSVLAWTVGCQLVRMALAFLHLSPYLPLTLLYTCPPLMHLYLRKMGWAKSVLPNLPIRIAEVLLGRRGSLLVLIPAHITGCILGVTMIRMFFSLFFDDVSYSKNEGATGTMAGGGEGRTNNNPLPFFIELSFMPTIYTTINQYTLDPFRLLSTFLMEIWNTTLYVLLFLVLPALLKVNRFPIWYTYLFLFPLLVTWDTDSFSYTRNFNFATNIDSNSGAMESYSYSSYANYGYWLKSELPCHSNFLSSTFMNIFRTVKEVEAEAEAVADGNSDESYKKTKSRQQQQLKKHQQEQQDKSQGKQLKMESEIAMEMETEATGKKRIPSSKRKKEEKERQNSDFPGNFNEKVKLSVLTNDDSTGETSKLLKAMSEDDDADDANDQKVERKRKQDDMSCQNSNSNTHFANHNHRLISEDIEMILHSLYSNGPLLYAPILWGLYYTYPKESLDQIYEYIVEIPPYQDINQDHNATTRTTATTATTTTTTTATGTGAGTGTGTTGSRLNTKTFVGGNEEFDREVGGKEREREREKRGFRSLLETKNNKWLGFFGYRYGYKYAHVPLIVYLRSFGSIIGGVLAGLIMSYMFPDSD